MSTRRGFILSGGVLMGHGPMGGRRDTIDVSQRTTTEEALMSDRPGSVEHINPEGLVRNPLFTTAVAVSGNVKTIYVGGLNAVDASGAIVGKGDLEAQSERMFANLNIALAAAGADLGHVVKWTIYVVQGQELQPGVAAFQRAWGDRSHPPAITMAFVAGLAVPDALVELEAIAVVPEE